MSRSLNAPSSEARDSLTESPEILDAALIKPPSITVDNSHIYDDDLKMAFYGIEDRGSSALVIGEQTLGRQLSRMDMLCPDIGVYLKLIFARKYNVDGLDDSTSL